MPGKKESLRAFQIKTDRKKGNKNFYFIFTEQIEKRRKMKNFAVTLMLCCLFALPGSAQSLREIKLNSPDKTRGVSIMKALELRKSDREFATEELSLSDLSGLLWAANGINRPGSGKRTAPSAMNRQDIEVYVCRADGVYLYEPVSHSLQPVGPGDVREFIAAGQAWVKTAPVCLVLVSDISKFGGDEARQLLTGAIDAGIVSQNISLFCAGTGLATVPRMSMDQEKLREALKLKASQHPILNHPVGYPR